MHRPSPEEYDVYYSTYIDKVGDGDIIELLASELDTTLTLLRSVPAERETHRYAEGKWSIREVVGHLIDAERTFGYRALAFARRDMAALPGMDQDRWAAAARADRRPLPRLAREFEHLRRSHVEMFAAFDEVTEIATGVASGYRFSVRSLAYILVGHELHHRQVLTERYLD